MLPFSKILSGQNNVLSILSKISNSKNIPHALLFSGPEGVGKFFTAIEFSKLVNFNSPNFEKISDKITQLSEPYVKLIFPLPRGNGETPDDSPTAKLSRDLIEEIQTQIKTKSQNPFFRFNISGANSIKISSIRDLKKSIAMSVADCKYRIIIINDAHLMNAESQNALLKSLEEPPEGIIFILLTSNKNQLLETIISRCWQINFSPLPNTDIETILTEYFDVEAKLAKEAAYFADGSVHSALSLVENDIDYILEKVINILRYSFAGKYNTAFNLIKEFTEKKSELSIQLLISFINKWLSDVLKARIGNEDIYFRTHIETITKFNEKFYDVDVSKPINLNNNFITYLQANVSLNIIAMNIIFELASIAKRY